MPNLAALVIEYFKFGFVTIISAILDYLIFTIAILLGWSITASLVTCRIISATFNYSANRKFVFNSKSKVTCSFISYGILAIFSFCAGLAGITFLSSLGMNVLLSKLAVECLLFVFNFIIQRNIIFAK